MVFVKGYLCFIT